MIGIQVGAIGLIAGTSLMWVIHSGVMADQMAAAIQIKSFRTTSLHGSHSWNPTVVSKQSSSQGGDGNAVPLSFPIQFCFPAFF
jgi:hypothetical protein